MTLTDELVEQAIAAMQRLAANYIYFFEKNESPDWIEPLAAKGFFRHPEPPVDREDGMRSYTVWPESQYLARMAPKAPELVTETLLALPATQNVFVHGDIVEAACALPGPQAARLSAAERKWIRSQGQLLWLLPDRYADLVVHLAGAGEADEAFMLAGALLEVLPDPRWEEVDDEARRYLTREPLARVRQWDYQEAAAKIAPALQAVDPIRTATFFADLLQNAMNLAEPIGVGDQSDNSYVWRPAVEDHDQNLPEHSIRDVLVKAVRDRSIATVESDRGAILTVVGLLERHRRTVFRRIALYLLAHHGQTAKDLAIKYLTDWGNLNDIGLRHEYAQLADAYFGSVPEADRIALLEHLRTPPPMENFRRNSVALYGREPTDEEIRHVVDGMVLKKLTILKSGLPIDWKKRYEELAARHGVPEHPDFSSYSSGGWVGPTSPKTSHELSAMELPDLLEFLRSWVPPMREMFADTVDGLGRELASAVANDPEKYAGAAPGFADLDPTYARSLIDGLEKGLTEKRPFDWRPVLELGLLIVNQEPEKEPDSGGWSDRDPGWRWARGSIARLLGDALLRSEGGIPIDHRELVWKILEVLTDDPEPNADYEARYGGSNMDPLTLSINTNRGKAMHAAIRYGLWVRRNNDGTHPEKASSGFDAMPELRKVLDAHLDPERDPSQAIRAVYGERLPWLVLLDSGWVKANLDRLFPNDPNLVHLRAAAWDTYLINRPYDSVFDVLSSEYHRAVSAIGETKDVGFGRRLVDPGGNLAEHLIALYWRGRITWENSERILVDFYQRAPDVVRAHAMEFVGRSLWQGQQPLATDEAERLKELWRRRVDAFESTKDTNRLEVAAFGWWFASSGKLDDDWLIAELLRVLGAGVPVDADHLVIERLADMAPMRPYEAVRAIRLLTNLKSEAHFLLTTNEALRRTASAALISEDKKAGTEARDLMNELAARGYRGLDDLASEL